MHRPRLSALVLLVAAGTLAACSSGGTSSKGSPGGHEAGAEHVHGLGVDPADGVLYAATHHGLFRVADGRATRVGDTFEDTMGFTVTGPHTFLGSGHPDAQREPDLPGDLGLMRSTTAGQTWTTVSLGGSVDFHALHVAQGLICGWDSGTGSFMASTDQGQTWQARSVVQLWDFALDARGTQVLATGEQGLRRSTDGGRTWAPVAGAPQLVVLAWPSAGALYGVAPDGTVQVSADQGRTWTARGTAGGQPEAVTVDDRGGKQSVYVATPAGIMGSTDGGRTFSTLAPLT